MTATSGIQEESTFQLPARMRGLQPTLIRQFFERALPDSINFGLGEPDLPTPEFLRKEAARIALEEQNGYTSHPGIPALRKKIAEQYPHLGLDMNDVVVTVGSQEAMTAAFLCLVDAGDDVLLPNPSFPAYDACVKISQGNPVYYRLPAEKDFAFDIDEFKRSITPKTKVAVVISPSGYNDRSGLMVCCPLSTRIKGHPFEVVTQLDGRDCAVLSDQVKSLDWKARRAVKKGVVAPEVMNHVRAKLKALLGIS
jgi:mRNA-degrading endonuclease toxin of MazEF toxin-antitoxin module